MKLITNVGKGWRTVIFNAALGGLALTDWLTGGEIVRAVISDPEDAALAMAVITAVNLVLRKFTSTRIGSKQ